MWELVEFLLSALGDIAEAALAWRFFLCLVVGVLLVTAICSYVSGETLRLVLTVPVMLAAVITGAIWEWRYGL